MNQYVLGLGVLAQLHLIESLANSCRCLIKELIRCTLLSFLIFNFQCKHTSVNKVTHIVIISSLKHTLLYDDTQKHSQGALQLVLLEVSFTCYIVICHVSTHYIFVCAFVYFYALQSDKKWV